MTKYTIASPIDMNQALDQLRGMVQSIRQRSRFQLSPTVEGLIDQAVQQRGTPKDVAAWARTIADDVAETGV